MVSCGSGFEDEGVLEVLGWGRLGVVSTWCEKEGCGDMAGILAMSSHTFKHTFTHSFTNILRGHGHVAYHVIAHT